MAWVALKNVKTMSAKHGRSEVHSTLNEGVKIWTRERNITLIFPYLSNMNCIFQSSLWKTQEFNINHNHGPLRLKWLDDINTDI